MEVKIEIGQWGGGKREPKTLRNYSEVLKLYAKLNDHHYISAPSALGSDVENWQRAERFRVWSYGKNSCWDDNVASDYPTYLKCRELATRYNAIKKATDLHKRRRSDDLTPCPKCKREKAVEFSQGPWADSWDCLYCEHKHEYRLGD